MTMEDRSAGIERGVVTSDTMSSKAVICKELPSNASYPVQRACGKRSFDVAFLIGPDENLARRQNAKLRVASVERLIELRKERSQESDRLPQNLTMKHYEAEQGRSMKMDASVPLNGPYMSPRALTPTLPERSPEPEGRRYTPMRLQKTPSPTFRHHQQPDAIIGRCGNDQIDLCCMERQHESRSAFTKVVLSSQRNGFDDNQNSPRSSISPDRSSYHSSASPPVISPLPGTMSYKYASGFQAAKMPYPFLVTAEGQPPGHILENLKMPRTPDTLNSKVASFRPELPSVYPNLSYNPISAVFPPMPDALARPRFLATASLLPPSFATLALPAQNVCAKCNLSFRMTSDLVYHMRSHHKSETVTESARRRREDKLRCPVCDESFRERHHLTRHMTAHQDKASDAVVDQVEVKRRAATVHGK